MSIKILKYCVVILVSIHFFSCSLHKEKFSYPKYKNENQSWIDAYKYNVFLNCVKVGIENDSLMIILKRKDLYYPGRSVLTFYYIDEARDKGREVIEKLPPPYIKIDIGDEEFYEGKNYISFTCLKYYASRDLDRTARKAYKEFVKQRKKAESEWLK